MALQSLDIAKDLNAAGVEKAQAEAIGSAIVRAVSEQEAKFVTKSDFAGFEERMLAQFERIAEKIDGVEQTLDAKIDGVEQRLDAKIDGAEQRLDAKIDAVEQRLDAKIDLVDQKLTSRIDKDVGDLRGRFEKDVGELRIATNSLVDRVRLQVLLSLGAVVGIVAALFRLFT